MVDLFSNWDFSLAKSQNHTCPICEQTLYGEFPLQHHHIVPISQGGENKLTNIVLVHLHSHYHVHYGGELENWILTLKQYKATHSTKLGPSDLKYNEIVD